MEKVLGIYGAGGLGREVLELARLINQISKKWKDIIFIADADTHKTVDGADVFSYEMAKETYKEQLQAVIGIGEPSVREIIFRKLATDQMEMPSLIHPDVHIPGTTKIGCGTIITLGCSISGNIVIGDNVYIQPHSNIGHDCVFEEGCVIYSNIAGNVHIGAYTYVGMGSCIKESVTIGKYTIVGMASAVFHNLPDEVIALGNPARVIKKNENRTVF